MQEGASLADVATLGTALSGEQSLRELKAPVHL